MEERRSFSKDLGTHSRGSSMNDPHVVALLYQIEHGRGVDYGEAEPIDHEERDFRVEIVNEQVRFEFSDTRFV